MHFVEFVSFAHFLDVTFPNATQQQKLKAYFLFLNGEAAPSPEPGDPLEVWVAKMKLPEGPQSGLDAPAD